MGTSRVRPRPVTTFKGNITTCLCAARNDLAQREILMMQGRGADLQEPGP